MKKDKAIKRFVAFFLCAAMLFTYMPSPTFSYAEDGSGDAVAAQEAAPEPAKEKASEPAPAPEPEPVKEEASEPAPEPEPAQEEASEPVSEETQEEAGEVAVDETSEEAAATEEAVPEEEAVKEEEDEYPAQHFTGSDGGVSVVIDAPKGALPEDTKMSVKSVSADSVRDAVEDAIGAEAATIKAVDITFRKDGKEIEPKKAVSVKMNASGMNNEANQSVVHIADNGSASVVTENVNNGSASFNAKDFSVYIVVDNEIPSEDINAVATYDFYVGSEKKSTQHIKSGDTLVDPGALGAGNGANSVFKGWYVADDQEAGYGEEPGAALTFGVKGTVPKTGTIKIVAKVETTYYVTFLGEKQNDERGIVAVDTVTVEGEAGTEGTLDISNRSVIPKADTSAFEGWSESDDGELIEGTTITVTDDKTLYAKVVDANWIHFDENVDYETSDSDPTYTGPVFVKKTDYVKDKKPKDPTRPGYTFDKWYEEPACTTAFNWDKATPGINEDITLYAKWIPDQADYTVIIWKQKVSDSKNADADSKTYDFESSIPLTGTTGAALNEADFVEYTKYEYTGFHYANKIKFEPGTIKADGTTVVNVYYDRNLLTINFIDGSHTKYVEATDNNGIQYGLVDGQYIRLNRNGGRWEYTESGDYNGTFYHQVYGNNGTQYGLVNGTLVQLTRQNNRWYANGQRYEGDRYATGAGNWGQTSYGVVNGTFTALNYDFWTGDYTYNITRTYTDTRYKMQVVPHQETYTGLYGQTLAQNDYTWPDDRAWYQNPDSGGTRLTFLDAFKFEGLSGVSENNTVLTQYGAAQTGTNSIRFYKQNLDESWPTTATNTVTTTGGTFTITEKYEGFTAVQYRNGTGQWTNGGAGTSGISSNNLQIRFQRNKYNLTFVSEGATVQTVENIPYEKNLSIYENAAAEPTKKHHRFVGWFEDPEGKAPFNWNTTMPSANKVVYAGFEMVQYNVKLDANGGEIGGTQWSEFNVNPGIILDRDSLTQNLSYTADNKHEFVGWFYKSGDKAGSPYEYDKIEHDIDLIAKWRMPGQVSIVYDAGKGGEAYTDDTQPDKFKYATDSDVVLAAPPKIKDGYTFVGWKLKDKNGNVIDKIYYSGNTFKIADNLIADYDEEDKTGTIYIVADYLENDEGPFEKTYIRWFKNDGSPCFHVDTIESPTGDTADSTLLVNEPVSIQAAPTREGYDFLGWAKVEDTGDSISKEQNLGEGDLFIKYDGSYKAKETGAACTQVAADNDRQYQAMFAVWKLKTYTVKYTDGVADEQVFADESHPGLTVNDTTPRFNNGTDPERDDYDFDGWDPAYTSALATDKADSNNVITYTAKWKEKEVEIKYVAAPAAGGSVDPASEKVKVKTGTAAGSTATANDGYVFVNWTDADGNEVSTSATFVPDKVGGKNVAATYTANFRSAKADVVVEHYLKGETAAFKTDTVKDKTVGEEYTATLETTYQSKSLTEDTESTTPAGHKITVAASDNLIKIYYTIPLTVKAENKNKAYDGNKLEGEYTVTGALDSDSSAIESALGTAPSIINVADSPKEYLTETEQAAIAGIPAYYSVTYTPGTLTITPAKMTITITGKTDEVTYDGNYHMVEGYTKTGDNPSLFDGSKVSYDGQSTPGITSKDAGKYEMGLTDTAFKYTDTNVDATFVINDGWVLINPAEVTITTGSAEKEYDGTALTNDEASISGLVSADEGKVTVAATGSQTEAGSSDNTYDIDWGDVNKDNYKVTEKLGTLTVTEPAAKTADITYDLNGGTYNGSTASIVETYDIGEKITIHEAPTRDGYDFVEWRGSSYQPGDSYTVEGDHTFTAIWTAATTDDDEDATDDSDKSEKKDKSDSSKGVKTGDDTDIMGLLSLMAASLAGFIALLFRRRREQE